MPARIDDGRFVAAARSIVKGGTLAADAASRLRHGAIGVVCALLGLVWALGALASLLSGSLVSFAGIGLMTLAVGWRAKRSLTKAFRRTQA